MKHLLWLLAISFVSCNVEDKREGTHTPDGDYVIFHEYTTGWTTRYPKSWPLISPLEIASLESRGTKSFEQAGAGEIEIHHRNLLWLQKDKLNSMTSNYEVINPYADPFNKTVENLTELVQSAYLNKGMEFESWPGMATIDGLDFSTLEVQIYSPDRSDTLMSQIMYFRLVQDTVFLTLNINYGNKADRDTLLSIINSSKFYHRN